MEEIIIKVSLKKKMVSILIFFLGGPLLVSGSIIAITQGNILIGLFGAIFFSLGIIAGIKLNFGGDKNIYITDEGIKTKFPRINKKTFIPWEEIRNVRILSIKTNITIKTLEIFLNNPEKFLGKPSALAEGLQKSFINVGYKATNINPEIFDQYEKPDLSLMDTYEKPLEEIAVIIKQRLNK